MSVEKDRLLSLLEFTKHAVLLRSKPAAAVTQHRLFHLHEHEIQGLPGIHVNVSDPESEGELWFSVERLHEARPPEITSQFLKPWAKITANPTEEPRLLESIAGIRLIEAGTHCSLADPPQHGKPQLDPDSTIVLSEYEKVVLVRSEFETYLNTRWLPWAEEERIRRKTIAIYSKLFTLKQQLEGGIIETQLELVWGVGIGVWKHDGTDVLYPLIGRLVELSLNAQTAELEVRPRDVDARLELDWYASVGNPGVTKLEKAAREFITKTKTIFSPFDHGTFEPLLRTAATELDVNGIYWPNEVPAEDRKLPRPDDKLRVSWFNGKWNFPG